MSITKLGIARLVAMPSDKPGHHDDTTHRHEVTLVCDHETDPITGRVPLGLMGCTHNIGASAQTEEEATALAFERARVGDWYIFGEVHLCPDHKP